GTERGGRCPSPIGIAISGGYGKLPIVKEGAALLKGKKRAADVSEHLPPKFSLLKRSFSERFLS
ncbi:hypothetical protein, partial [Bacteroides uniformis]|uniref:hypothetical protein n=1 Tax=Bacteroides uniformis TaxID=820 RepID=UPI001AA13DB5